MKINEREQQHLLTALRLQLEDDRAKIQSTERTLDGQLSNGPLSSEVRTFLEQDLRNAFGIEQEHRDLIKKIEAEVV